MKYPDLKVYLSEGEPRFELLLNGDKVDTVRVGRYDMSALKRILAEFGLKRDETLTWERKQAEVKMERAFREASLSSSKEEL